MVINNILYTMINPLGSEVKSCKYLISVIKTAMACVALSHLRAKI